MPTKICSKCNIEKDITEFHVCKHNKDGYRGWCKLCCRQYMEDHREQKQAREKKYSKTRKAYKNAYLKEYRNRPDVKRKLKEKRQTEKHKEYYRKYTTTEKYREYVRKYRQEHIDEIRPKELAKDRAFRKTPEGKIIRSLRGRLGVILKRSKSSKSEKFIIIIGCTMPFLRNYLESLWEDGMSWDNYGSGQGRWVIDHIIPCYSFKPFTPEQQRQCFHYTNLQPLWWKENASKSNKLTY